MRKTAAASGVLKVVSVKMTPALKLRLDIYCAKAQRHIQEVVAEAVEDLLKRKG